MMRISREDEHAIGGARPSIHGRAKVGFAKDGRITAVDLFAIGDNGPYEQQFDTAATGLIVSLLYQPPAMRWRGMTVLTNTPPRRAQSQPGGMQGITIMERVVNTAAHKLGIDQVEMRRINAPEGKAPLGPVRPNGQHVMHSTSCFLKQALARGVDLFDWEARKGGSGKRVASKVRGVGAAMSVFFAGSSGYDGLLVVKPDGHLYVQSGIGNHGTESVSDVHRVAAEMLGIPWDKCVVTWGDTVEKPAVDVCVGWKPDDAGHDAGGARRCLRCTPEVSGDCGHASRRTPRGLRPRERARLQSERWAWHDARPGCAGRDRARRKIRRA